MFEVLLGARLEEISDGEGCDGSVSTSEYDAVTVLGGLKTPELSRDSVVCQLDSVSPSEESDGLPATVIVEDVLVGASEQTDHLEYPLCYLGYQGPHNLS